MEHPSILVVDDELLIRDLLYDFFQDQGWDIAVAESGEQALEILEEKKVDVLLTDLRMPAMDGMALTGQVRKSFPGIPVVIMTGYPSVESAVSALRNKVADYITKPFNVNELYKRVESHLPREDEETA
ncbi:MAG: response regulator [candidate division Zixibacteria bacterium]|jgi:DNA-binding NtrC family response regulator|nr:response regulator [candidate division Zixibacteria bacterium]